MNLGHEQIPDIGTTIQVEITKRIREETDAFILETITPFCELEAGRRLEKAELKEIILKATITPATMHGDCPRCFLDLTTACYAYGFGIEYCPRCGQRVGLPKAPKEEAEE
ncbi:MAG: hypothetical protein IKD62_01250 [Oscillospiraceae bacterium]|nr:hypothetical protein [Oscillospiraceae bacterium]